MSSITSTPASSAINTPNQTRPSSPVHAEHSDSKMKTLWKDLKHRVVEHHHSINAAYASYYAAGHGLARPEQFGLPRTQSLGQANARI